MMGMMGSDSEDKAGTDLAAVEALLTNAKALKEQAERLRVAPRTDETPTEMQVRLLGSQASAILSAASSLLAVAQMQLEREQRHQEHMGGDSEDAPGSMNDMIRNYRQ